MTRNVLIPSLLVLAFTTISRIAQADTLVLVPVFFAGPGAFGSSWNTQLTILNNSDKPLMSIPYIYACPIPEGCLDAIPAHASVAFVAGAPNCPTCFQFSTGFFENIRSDEIGQPVFSLRIFDQSQSTADYGAELPVVTAAAFKETELQFLDVVADPHFRTTLRIYSLPNQVASVRIRSFQEPPPGFGSPQAASILIGETFASLTPPPSGPSATLHGPSVVVDSPLQVQNNTDGSRYRVTVQSITPGVPVWALLTVTNNQTQRVAVIAPQ